MDISVMQKMIAEKKLIAEKAPSLWRVFRRDVSVACDRSEGILRLEYDMKPDEQLGMEKAVVIDLTPMPETQLRLSYNEIEAAIYSVSSRKLHFVRGHWKLGHLSDGDDSKME